MTHLPDNAFRAGVGAIVISDRGDVLAFERLKIPDAWQFPQGGLDEGEDPRECVMRELAEETGLTAGDVELLAESRTWHAYELPEAKRGERLGRGQVQKWFLFRLTGSEAAIRLDRDEHPEFRAWRWMKMDDLIAKTAPFRRPVYRAVKEEFREYFKEGAEG